MVFKTCKWCGSIYEFSAQHKEYCCDECRETARRARDKTRKRVLKEQRENNKAPRKRKEDWNLPVQEEHEDTIDFWDWVRQYNLDLRKNGAKPIVDYKVLSREYERQILVSCQ